MHEPQPPPDALDRLAREVGKENAKSGGASTGGFGWPGAGSSPARIGRFEISGGLGRGGMGVVYHAFDPVHKKEVALKSLAAGPGDRLRREGEAIARLDHPGIVKIYETGEDFGKPFLVMELVKGRSLDEAWAGWDLRRRVEAVEKIARAVAHAHERGVTHRDLKPANVLVGEDGQPRVTDFGLAALEGEGTKLTNPGSVMGTPSWMAPEQVRGDKAGPPADVFALGVILYQALTNALPFEGPNAPRVYDRILHADPARPCKRATGIPVALEAVCFRALEKTARSRYAHAGDFADDLAAWLAGRAVRARFPGPAALLWKRVLRNPLAAGGLGLAAASLLAGAVIIGRLSWLHAREQRARDLYREAQPLAAQAVTALQAGDRSEADRLFSRFLMAVGEARRTDPQFHAGSFERAEFNRLLGDESSAWSAVEEGLRFEPGSAVGLVERGILRATRFRRELRRVTAMLEVAEQEAARREEREPRRILSSDAENSDPALAALRRDAEADLTAGVAGLGGDPPSAKLARAELATARGELAEAEAALGGLEWAEAKVLRGTIAESRDDLDGAEEWFTRAIATREDAFDAWEARANVRQRRGERLWTPGEEGGEKEMASSVSDWSHLVESGRRGSLAGRASANGALGRMQLYRQADPTAALRASAADAQAALDVDARDAAAAESLARSLEWLAGWEGAHREDPDLTYGRAVAAFKSVLRLRPRDAALQIELGSTLRMRAFNRRTRGIDATAIYEEALRSLDAALAIDPKLWIAHADKGQIHGEMGRWKEAVTDYEAARRTIPRPWSELDNDLEEARRQAGGS